MAKEKAVVIMGLGLHGGGVGAANYFIEKGYRVTVTDLKPREGLKESIKKLKPAKRLRLVLGRHEFKDFRTADLVVKNPAVPRDSPYLAAARESGVRVDSDIGIFFDLVKDRTSNIVGITGTKGKSTTSSLIHTIMKEKWKNPVLCGNITVSVFDVLQSIRKSTYLIIELSSFQLGDIKQKEYSPRIGVFTSFMEDHLNYYRTMGDYFEDKAVLYRWQRSGDVLVYNRDGELPGLIRPNEGVSVFTFGLGQDFEGEGIFIRDGRILLRTGTEEVEVMDTADVRLPGRHNLYNVLAAACVALIERVAPSTIAGAVGKFRGLEHRLERVGEKDGVIFYNDSAATNPDAAVMAIQSIGSPITLIAGGYDKGLSLKKLADSINSGVFRLVLLEGNGTGRLLQEGIREGYEICGDMGEAVRHAYDATEPGGSVLLSPGFASFGMFSNEFERGNEFKTAVKEIIDEG
jgi:UDP-N-acetylmuramoylalanine--D-glutamate ligase